MAQTNIDWSEFEPVTNAPAKTADVDWSQFEPVEAPAKDPFLQEPESRAATGTGALLTGAAAALTPRPSARALMERAMGRGVEATTEATMEPGRLLPMPPKTLGDVTRQQAGEGRTPTMAEIQATPLGRAGQQLTEAGESIRPENPSLMSKVAGGAAGFLPVLAAGPVAPVAIGLQATGEALNESYAEAKEQGLTDEQATEQALVKAKASGVTQAALWTLLPGPLKALVGKATGLAGEGAVKQFLARRAVGATEGGLLGAASQATQNVTTGQPVGKDVGPAAAGMALIGGITPQEDLINRASKVLPNAAAEAAKVEPKPEQPTAEEKSNASEKQQATEVHGNVRTFAGKSEGAVPVEEGGARVQPQAEGGLPEAEKSPVLLKQAQPAPIVPGVFAFDIPGKDAGIKEINEAPDHVLAGLANERGPDGTLVWRAQEQGVRHGMTLAEKDVPALEKMRDENQKQVIAGIKEEMRATTDEAKATAQQKHLAAGQRNLWASGAIEGARRKGPNYDKTVAIDKGMVEGQAASRETAGAPSSGVAEGPSPEPAGVAGVPGTTATAPVTETPAGVGTGEANAKGGLPQPADRGVPTGQPAGPAVKPTDEQLHNAVADAFTKTMESLKAAGWKFDPQWGPLEVVLKPESLDQFMFMGKHPHPTMPGRSLYEYKNGITRRYLRLDDEGQAYGYDHNAKTAAGKYPPIPLEQAIDRAFEGVEQMGETRESKYNEAFRRKRDEALIKSGFGISRATPEGTLTSMPKAGDKPIEKVQKQVTKVVAAEGTRSAKEIKTELVGRLQKAIVEAPNEDAIPVAKDLARLRTVKQQFLLSPSPLSDKFAAEAYAIQQKYQPDQGPKFWASDAFERILENQIKHDKVVIDIPGDGKFTIVNTKEALQQVLDRAKKLDTRSGGGQNFRNRGVPEAPIEIKTVGDFNKAVEFFDLKGADTIAERSNAMAEVAKKVDAIAPEKVTVTNVRNWLEERKHGKTGEAPMPPGPGAATAKVEGEGSGLPTIEDQISGKLAPARPAPKPDVTPQSEPAVKGMVSAIKSAVENVKGFVGTVAGKTFPRITLKSKALGELAARWISSRIAAQPVAEVFAADVIGDSGVDHRKLGAALSEDNLRSVKKAFADAGQEEKAQLVFSLIDKRGSPFKTEAEYQKFLNDPKVKEVIARHIDLWKNVVEPQYKEAMLLDPELELPSRGLQTGARINLKAVLEDEENPRDVVRSVGRGNLMGTLRRKSPFGVQARGTGDAYHVNYYDLMENTFGKQLEIANKNAFEKAMVDAGQAVIAPPGEKVMIDGQRAVAFPLKRQRAIIPSYEEGTKSVSQNQNLYVNRRLATEYRIGANVDMKPPSLAVQKVNGALNTAALASATDATTHMINLTSSLMTLPGTSGRLLNDSILSALPGRPDALVSVARALVKGFQDNRAQLASLAEIGALKEPHEPSRVPGMKQAGQLIQWLDRSTRLALDDSYKRLAQDGLVENSETARREFINQIGQYNKRAQGFYKRFFRDSGLGPFVTAGTTFNTLGVRAATLNPGVKAASLPAALALRANMAAKIVGTVGTIATLNYLLTKDKKNGGAMGRPGVPLGAIDLGTDDKNGRPQYLAIFNMTSAGRGLRVLGVRGFAQAKLQGLPNEVALDSGARDIINSVIAPWAGPPMKFAVGAATGFPTAIGVGRQSAVVPPGQSQKLEDFKQAVIQASPLAAGIQKANQPGTTGISEVLKSQLPRLTPQPGKPPSMMQDYPGIVRRAQANAYIEDVIGRARKMDPESRTKFLQDSVDRLEDPGDQKRAWREFKYRKVF